ncbi:MAG: phosphoribosylaminoimidazolesuccinocarboxamide synthase [Thermodesulfobacteria bacterium]|nr:phosphoribosylaminoimidazolesuccinocarboxamide synthase [Thermodesulfobacteriota bacterium]
MAEAVFQTDIKELKLIHRGKVRDLYECGDNILMVATDRISAFDVVFNEPVPDKGRVLTQISLFWFDRLKDMVPNHLVEWDVDKFPPELAPYRSELEGRSVIVKKAKPLAIECIVRGYITGSGWKEYLKTGAVCGIKLPEGLKESEKLPEPIFTPSTKAEIGEHDENISFEKACEIVGEDTANQVKELSLSIYKDASEYALSKGIIIADTKFEFGFIDGRLCLIDEVLTPDSSRFWPLDSYKPGGPQPSFDKQFVRDYLESIGWDKKPPAPPLPPDIIEKTRKRYLEAYERITGSKLV